MIFLVSGFVAAVALFAVLALASLFCAGRTVLLWRREGRFSSLVANSLAWTAFWGAVALELNQATCSFALDGFQGSGVTCERPVDLLSPALLLTFVAATAYGLWRAERTGDPAAKSQLLALPLAAFSLWSLLGALGS